MRVKREQFLRHWTILIALTSLIGCAPPHPTHPTKVECRLEVETRFSALVSTTTAGTVQPGRDPCDPGGFGGASPMEWTQRGPIVVSVCMVAGTTPEQAASQCSRYLESTDRRVGTGATPLAAHAPSGRICDGSLRVLSSQITSTVGIPSLRPNECYQGTELPLAP